MKTRSKSKKAAIRRKQGKSPKRYILTTKVALKSGIDDPRDDMLD